MHRPWAIQRITEDGEVLSEHRLPSYSDIEGECPDANMEWVNFALTRKFMF